MFNDIKNNIKGESVAMQAHEIHLLTEPLFICTHFPGNPPESF